MIPAAPLLSVTGLTVTFTGAPRRFLRAVDGVSLHVDNGEVLGLVGESGCGKSSLARAVMGLVPFSGSVTLDGVAWQTLSRQERRRERSKIQMVFQNPYTSLNGRMTIFDTLAEPLRLHRNLRGDELPQEIARLMQEVGLEPENSRRYPHEFSGGQRQRIAIARALASGPKMLVADEPVSALDVSIQAQIINLLQTLVARQNLSMLFISHDLAVVRHLAQRIAVMYAGRIMESGAAEDVFVKPAHPYTRMLLSAILTPDPRLAQKTVAGFMDKGEISAAAFAAAGCPFAPRCNYAIDKCTQTAPPLVNVAEGGNRCAACIRIGEI
ncbi:MAG: ABC transporter ATP-binding protein [Chitinivibrionales bacterium]|nr:ABC transporter ATP-binding protein [Chitinivibrionales bacterium]